MLAAAAHESSAGYDIVLVAHVLSAVVAAVAVGTAAGSALALRAALRADRPIGSSLERYYRPGINWAGRTLMLVPVLGVALVFMSGGQWTMADPWVSAGLALWLAAAIVAESLLWPAERRLQADVAAGVDPGSPNRSVELHVLLCIRTAAMGIGILVALVAATVLMVAKPGG